MSDHYKIAVLGDQDSVLGFKALGLDVFPAETVEEGRETLHRLARESYAIVYLTEQLAQGLAPEIARYKDDLTPAIILIPGKSGSLGIGMDNVKKSVERAVGEDILYEVLREPPPILRMGPPAKPRDFVGERRGSRANEPWRLRRGEGCTACPDEKEGRYI